MDKKMIMAGLVVATIVGAVGGTMINSLQAHAADTPTPTADTQVTPNTGKTDPSQGGHVGANGKKEELLTGDTAEKVKAAALAAVLGGTIERVETDAEGSPYEAHMTKSDGSRVTVKLDSDLKVTTTETGNGPGTATH